MASDPEKQRAAHRRYKQSEKGQVAQRRYEQSEKRRAARRRYNQSEKGRAARRRYNQSEKGQAADRRHVQSGKRRVTQRRYIQSEKGRAVIRRRRMENKARVDEIKLRCGCVDCLPNRRYKHPAYALHFDHLRDKKFGISRMLSRSWPAIEVEIAKCVVRCLEHHVKATADKNHYRRDAPVQVALFEQVYVQERLFG